MDEKIEKYKKWLAKIIKEYDMAKNDFDSCKRQSFYSRSLGIKMKEYKAQINILETIITDLESFKEEK